MSMRRQSRCWLASAAAALAASPTLAAPGDLDPTYGSGGRAVPESPPFGIGAVLPVTGDRVVYSVWSGNGVQVRRLDARGLRDPSFGTGSDLALSGVMNVGSAGAVAADGRLLFGIEAQETVDGKLRGFIAVLGIRADGRPDTAFGAKRDGIAALSWLPSGPGPLVALAAYPDGRVAVAEYDGSSDLFCGDAYIRRLRADGTEDPAFGGGSPVRLRNVDSGCEPPTLAPQADGSLFVAFGNAAYRLNTDGATDPAFGTGGTASTGDDRTYRTAALASGGFLAASRYDPARRGGSASIRLTRFLRTGQLDPAFGAGTGSVTISAGAALTGRTDLIEEVRDLVISRDERQVYLLVDIRSADLAPRPTRYACLAVARATAAGALDATYGHNGVACLLRGAQGGNEFESLVHREDGSVLVDSRYPPGRNLRRLFDDATPSPGVLSIQSDFGIVESTGRVTVTIGRSAGAHGAVSVEYSTRDVLGTTDPSNRAAGGVDYRPVSGRLDWASGDSSDRTVTIDLLDDRLEENPEYFDLVLTGATGGAILIGATRTLQIDDDDRRSTATPTPTASATAAGGGGAGAPGWGALATLVAMLLAGRRGTHPSSCEANGIRRRTQGPAQRR